MARPAWLKYFDELPEPRVERTRKHKLTDIVLIMVIAAICRCEGWQDAHDMVEDGPAELRELLELPNGVPSADTLRRVMGMLDKQAFGEALVAWSAHLCQATEGKLVAIDGKTVRGAFRNNEGSPLHIVNAWVSENALVLGQLSTDAKSNESSAIPQLLSLLHIEGAVVSIDAMGCQKKIAKAIRTKGANYLLSLKKNHATLHNEVLEAFDEDTCERLQQSPETYFEQVDKGHGRLEVRRIWVQKDVQWLYQSDRWQDLKTIVMVEATRTLRGKTSCVRRTFISSLDVGAERLLAYIRAHWHIENKLHWVLDVTFKEDSARINTKMVPKTSLSYAKLP